MLNIHKFQSGYELFTTLCIVGDSNLAVIYEYLTSSRSSYCKNESIVIVISGNWEYETGIFTLNMYMHKLCFHLQANFVREFVTGNCFIEFSFFD